MLLRRAANTLVVSAINVNAFGSFVIRVTVICTMFFSGNVSILFKIADNDTGYDTHYRRRIIPDSYSVRQRQYCMSEISSFRRNGQRLAHLLLRRNRLLRIKRFIRFRNAQRMLQLAEQEMRDQTTLVRSHPVYMNLDTGPLCNLQCKFCTTANGIGTLKRELLKPDVFERIVKNLPLDSLYQVGLYNWGEPLLNPDLLSYIQFFAQRGIWTVIHTNFSVKEYDEAFMEALIHSGIDDITASVDGATQANYEKYRVGGNLERVLANIGLLARTKRRLKMDTPIITYKMMLNRFNEHEVDAAHEIASSLGVEFLVQETIGTPDDQTRAEWAATFMLEQHGDITISGIDKGRDDPVVTECRQMWDSLIVNADGAVFPCCIIHTPDSAVGNLTTQSFEEVWNGEKMQQLRRYALDNNASAPRFPNSCASCSFRNCTYLNRKQLAKTSS